MERRSLWRIWADWTNPGDDLPDWVRKTSYWWNHKPDQDSYLLYRWWYIGCHTKLSSVPVSHDHMPHSFSSLSFSCSTLQSPINTKLSHSSLSLHAMNAQFTQSTVYTEYSTHRIQQEPSTAYIEYILHRVLHTLLTVSFQDRLSPTPSQPLTSRQTLLYSILYNPTIMS